MEKIKLEVLGLSYSQTQAGAYALILSVNQSDERIPIIIGGFEAQSIAIQLENLKPPRPLTHDLFKTVATDFEINLKEVFIYRLEEGIFYSRLYFEKDGATKAVDSRTSDAVALALRFGCPIYTTTEIVSKAGIVLKITDDNREDDDTSILKTSPSSSPSGYRNYTVEELESLMDEAIRNEDYEKASLIRDEIQKKKNSL
ncbi:MAG: bifunctional nuclease family protein [Bacteroidales bacterium]|jgi:bifunctional DNase/RNase|nr:bifunctional nuclease family protein [Bacteroidales bacterium]